MACIPNSDTSCAIFMILDFASPVAEMFTYFCYTNSVLMAFRNVTEVILKCMHVYMYRLLEVETRSS